MLNTHKKIVPSVFLLFILTRSIAQVEIEYCDTAFYHSYRDEIGLHCIFKRQIAQDGFYKSFKNKSAIEEFSVRNHEINGPYKYFKSGGNLMVEGNYLNGFKSGLWKSFNPSNSTLLSSLLVYKDGKLKGKALYYDSNKGAIQFKGFYENNKKSGKWKIYENGKCAGKLKFKNGIILSSYAESNLWKAYKWRLESTQ